MIKYSRCVVYWLILLLLNLGIAGDNLIKEESVTQTHIDTDLIYDDLTIASQQKHAWPKNGSRPNKSMGSVTKIHSDMYNNDLKLTPEQKYAFFGIEPKSNRKRSQDSIAISGPKLWPKGVVMYKLSRSEPITQKDEAIVRDVMKMYQETSCIKFVEHGTREAAGLGDRYGFIHIKRLNGCYSFLGRLPRTEGQNVSLNDCGEGSTAHEFMHALGFFHEHTRQDRDLFVKVYLDKITHEKFKLNFKIPEESFGLAPYNEHSIMHYPPTAFSDNREKTIEALEPDLEFLMGQRKGLSHYDQAQIHLAYSCASHCKEACENDGYMNKNCKCICTKGLTGPTCTELDPSETEDGCGGFYKIVSHGESLEFGTNDHSSSFKKCAWIFSGPLGGSLRLTVSSMDMSDSVKFEVRWNLPGQPGRMYKEISSSQSFSTSRHQSDKRKPVIALFLEPGGSNDKMQFKASVLARGSNNVYSYGAFWYVLVVFRMLL